VGGCGVSGRIVSAQPNLVAFEFEREVIAQMEISQTHTRQLAEPFIMVADDVVHPLYGRCY
jgi:hypothetical protein